MSQKVDHSNQTAAPGPTSPNTVKSKVEERFTQTAVGYRISRVHAQGPEFAQLLAAANFSGDELIVDAGCGAGHTTAHLAPYVNQVIAVDLSAAMLEQAQAVCTEQGLTNVSFVQGDVEHLDVAVRSVTDRPVDAIVSRFSAHHWPDPKAALASFALLLQADPSTGDPSTDARFRLYLLDVVSLDNFVYDTHLQAIELLRDPSHVRDHSVSQWLDLFRQTGFQGESLYEWDLAIEIVDWVQRMQTPDVEVQALRNLFAGAPQEVRSRFNLDLDNDTFTFACGLLGARLAPG